MYISTEIQLICTHQKYFMTQINHNTEKPFDYFRLKVITQILIFLQMLETLFNTIINRCMALAVNKTNIMSNQELVQIMDTSPNYVNNSTISNQKFFRIIENEVPRAYFSAYFKKNSKNLFYNAINSINITYNTMSNQNKFISDTSPFYSYSSINLFYLGKT